MKILIMSFLIFSLSAYGLDAPSSLISRLTPLPKVKAALQAVIILGDDPSHSNARVYLCEKKGGNWLTLPDDFPTSVGKRGFAEPGGKQEGDGKSPTGVYSLSLTFGYSPVCDTKMPYRQATTNDFWVDDPESPLYNTWVRGKPAVKSLETMRRNDSLYKWGIVVDYNTGPIVPGKGSAIFLHVWKGPGSVTSGCAAFAEENVIRILSWLDPEKKPVVVMGVPKELLKLVKKE